MTGVEQARAVARLWLPASVDPRVVSGPRVGVAGVAGTDAFPWRFWIDGDPTVSPFRWGRGAGPAYGSRLPSCASSRASSRSIAVAARAVSWSWP